MRDQLAEGFGEGQVPADEEADGAEGRGDRGVGGRGGGGEVWAFGVPVVGRRLVVGGGGVGVGGGVPEVFLLVTPQDIAFIVDEIRHVDQLVLLLPRALMPFDDRPGHDADVVFFCQRLVAAQVGLPLRAEADKVRVGGHPVRQVVFGEHGEVGAAEGRARDEGGRFAEVGFGLHGLARG